MDDNGMAAVKGAGQWRGWKCKAWMGVGVDRGGGWVGGRGPSFFWK